MAAAQEGVHGALDFLFLGRISAEAALQKAVDGLVHLRHQGKGILPVFLGNGFFIENLPDSAAAIALGHGGAHQLLGGFSVVQELEFRKPGNGLLGVLHPLSLLHQPPL